MDKAFVEIVRPQAPLGQRLSKLRTDIAHEIIHQKTVNLVDSAFCQPERLATQLMTYSRVYQETNSWAQALLPALRRKTQRDIMSI